MDLNSIQTYFSNYKYAVLFNGNKHSFGFSNKLLLSNKWANQNSLENKDQICFLNYDYKNSIESFSKKSTNPLSFPISLFIEVEKEIAFNDIVKSEECSNYEKIKIKATVSKEEYINKVNALKQHIQLGDIYEINYCMAFEAFNVNIDPIDIYFRLNEISHAPFSALAKFDKQYIISSSPELFLSKKENTLMTKPIKGTAKRGATLEEDRKIQSQLQNSLKERTENVMIVDVARNDLSRIAKKGTVQVDSLFKIESFEQVHQMVSEVSCEVAENEQIKEIIRATFPMASMTGAPKIRAMQLIDEYEVYNRGPYSGALGYLNSNGDFDLNVLIRSIFFDTDKKYLSFSVGSAITSMCSAEEEYEECLLKAKAMFDILQ